MNLTLLSSILSEYDVNHIRRFHPVEGGIINQTYLVETGLGKFVLQGLNSDFPVDVILTQAAVGEYCASRGVVVPEILRTKDHCPFFTSANGDNWKLTKWINHGDIPPVNQSIESAAAYLAKFHNTVKTCPHVPSVLAIPHFHDREFFAKRLGEHIQGMTDESLSFAHDILRSMSEISLTPLNVQLIHADPKWNNFLFGHNGDVVAIIDLDTLMIGDILLDIGDAFRSWCKGPNNGFDKDLFERALSSYNSWSINRIGVEEALVSTKALALELSARFMIDVFEDRYFGWDTSKFRSRKDANLFRARQYFEYAENIV